MAYKEVMKHGNVSAKVGFVFATMPLQHVEYLLEHPQDLRSTLKGVGAELKDQKDRKGVALAQERPKGVASKTSFQKGVTQAQEHQKEVAPKTTLRERVAEEMGRKQRK